MPSSQPFNLTRKGGLMNVVQAAVAKEASPPNNSPFTIVEDEDVKPLSQSKWFQASAKVVRMSVLEHIRRADARSNVSEQLRVWANERVANYSKVVRSKYNNN
jgi:hypothetical protein